MKIVLSYINEILNFNGLSVMHLYLIYLKSMNIILDFGKLLFKTVAQF